MSRIMETCRKVKEIMAKGGPENQRKFWMACRNILQLGSDTNIQEKTYEPQQFEVYLLILVYLMMPQSLKLYCMNNKMISEYWIGKNAKGRDTGLMWNNIQTLSRRTWGDMNKGSPEYKAEKLINSFDQDIWLRGHGKEEI